MVKDTFLHLLIMASFRESSWMGRTIGAGQLVTSRHRLAEDLGFSVQQIRTALAKLESTSEITIETTNKYTVITVVNWDKYQVLDEVPTSTSTSRATNEQPTKNAVLCEQIVNKIKNLKKSTSKSTSKEEMESAVKSGLLDLEEFLLTSSSTNEQPSNNQQITNKQPHRKNVKNVKNVKNNNKGGSAAGFNESGFAGFLSEGE